MIAGADGQGAGAAPAALHPALTLLANAVADARKAAAMLAADSVWTASNRDLVLALRLREEGEAVFAAIGFTVIRECDSRGLAAADGQTSTALWLARQLHLHPGEGTSRVKTAQLLGTKAQATGEALLQGKLNASQARAVAAGLRRVDPHASPGEFTQAQEFLLREGRLLHSGQITRLARHIEAVLDPDGTPDKLERALASRSFTVTDLGNGRHRVCGLV